MKKINMKVIFITIGLVVLLGTISFLAIFFNLNNNKEDTTSPNQEEINEITPTVFDSSIGDGLSSVDDQDSQLTERQKIVLQYFDDNYASVYDYSYLKRYPDLFKQAKISLEVKVEKVLKSNENEFEVLASLATYGDTHDYVIIRGKQLAQRLIEGDCIKVRGRFLDNEDMTIDGVSYNLPVLEHHASNVCSTQGNCLFECPIYDMDFVRDVAKAIFGDNVNVRMATPDDLIIGVHSWSSFFVIATPENQSNANFTSFEIHANYPYIRDVKSNEHIERYFSYTSDFSHYLILVKDNDFKTLTLEYYDNNFNKIWSREFENTEISTFDTTDDNIYLVANNEFYIIDIKTGENVQEPISVSNRLSVHKLADGIFLCGKDGYDTFMFLGFDGQVKWQTDYEKSIDGIFNVQLIENDLVIELYQYTDECDGCIRTEYIRLSAQDGRIISRTELF